MTKKLNPQLSLRDLSKEFIDTLEWRCKTNPVSMGEYVCPSASMDEIPILDLETTAARPTSSVAGSMFTLTNTILGSGTLAVPFAIASSGWLLGMSIMVILALVTMYSVYLLLKASDAAGENCAKTYESLGHYTMGKFGTGLAEFTFIFGGFGTLVSYFIFTSSLFGAVLGLDPSQNWKIMVVCTFGVVIPLSLTRHIGKLQLTSLLATLSVTFVVCFCFFSHFFMGNNRKAGEYIGELDDHGDIVAIRWDSGTVYSVTLLIAAFACHNTTLPVYEELRNRSISRMGRAVSGAITFALLLYSMIGLGSYLTFGDRTKDNILLNFTPHLISLYPHLYIPLKIGQLCMGLALLFTCPIALWPFRSCILSVYLRLKTGRQVSSNMASQSEFLITTICVELSILFCAIFVPSVKTPLSIVGSVSGSLIIFILPSLFYLFLQPYPILSRHNIGPLLLLTSGICIGIVGFSLTMYKIFH